MVYNNLGVLYLDWGRPGQALQNLESSRKLRSISEGAPARESSTLLNNLGSAAYESGDLETAESYFLDALAKLEPAELPWDAQRAFAMNNVGVIRMEQGRLIDADRLISEAVKIWKDALGPDHPRVALAYGNLMALRIAQERYSEAEWFSARAIEMLRHSSPDHPQLAELLAGRAKILRKTGRGKQAKLFAERARQLRATNRLRNGLEHVVDVLSLQTGR